MRYWLQGTLLLQVRTTALGCLVALAGAAHAVGPDNVLNDTGVYWYGDGAVRVTDEPPTAPGQDGTRGRDAAARAGVLPKVGSGRSGFDFTKIANDGSVLPVSAALGSGTGDWACTYDNVTGLMWEVKVDNATHLRHLYHTYTWYDSNPATNGGNAGTASTASTPKTCRTRGRCDTEKFVLDVNAAGLCGHNDWRMPSVRELRSILDLGVRVDASELVAVAYDVAWFPNTKGATYDPTWTRWWTATTRTWTSPTSPPVAWVVGFDWGWSVIEQKDGSCHVRLVRVGQ